MAAWLNYNSVNNGAFQRCLAAARLFGFADRDADGHMAVTERSLAIIAPDYPETERQARVDAFLAVPLFAAVYEDYGGQRLPGEEGLKNALSNRYGHDERNASMAFGRLMDSAEQAGFFANGRDRLIRPTSNGSRAEASPERAPGADRSGSTGETGEPHSHPLPAGKSTQPPKLVQGLWEQLPDAEGAWSEEALEQWLKLAELVLRTVYVGRKTPPDQGGG